MISHTKELVLGTTLATIAFVTIACSASAKNEVFFGKTTPPERNILRYVTGDEPESIDPPVSSGQPEARIYMALYEGLVEYHPKTLEPIPAIADRFHANKDSSEFVFHLRKNARWSNGDPITAQDFVYTVRRALSPKLASRNASLAYDIRYAQAYNSAAVFVKDPVTNQFLLEEDFTDAVPPEAEPLSQKSIGAGELEYEITDEEPQQDADTAFHRFMHSPPRLTLPADEKRRTARVSANPKLQAAMAGKELVKVSGEDLGVEAIDDYTVRISLAQRAPFFSGLVAHPLFRFVPRQIIEKFGDRWTDAGNLVTSGAFKLKHWKPYHELVVERNPMYWDAARVQLEEIRFYPMSDNPAIMNLYKVGEVDATLNHSVPNAWLDVVRPKKDYMDGAEAAIVYININVTKAPMNDLRVRRAFAMAIDKITYAKARRITKPLFAFTPEGIFSGYPQPKGEGFDPEQARKLLGEAGFAVTQRGDGTYECKNFPVSEIEFVFNTASSNKTVAEFLQAQWKQTLGVTVPLRSMEFKTFMVVRNKLEYKGFSIGLWGADYMDPFTFLGIFSTVGGTNATGWFDQKYADMLNEANSTLDKAKRYELLARAEKLLLDAQPMIPIETSAVNFVKKPYLKGMYPNAASLYPWKFVYIERDTSKWDYGIPNMAE